MHRYFSACSDHRESPHAVSADKILGPIRSLEGELPRLELTQARLVDSLRRRCSRPVSLSSTTRRLHQILRCGPLESQLDGRLNQIGRRIEAAFQD